MPFVQWLRLNGNNIGDDGVRSLSAALVKGALAQATEISLSDNNIGDAGLEALAKVLGGGALGQLTCLHLSSNEISGLAP